MIQENITSPAVKYLVRLLSKRDYSVYKLKQKLQEKKYSKDESDFAIQYMLEKNWLREENYSKAKIQSLLNKGFSTNYIIQKLKLEKITVTESEINHIAQELSIASDSKLLNILQKKFHKTISQDHGPKEKLKMIRFLMSKGHSYDVALATVKKLC